MRRTISENSAANLPTRSTHVCASAAMMRTLRFRALFSTVEAGPDALRQNTAKTFYGPSRVFWIGPANAVSARSSMRRRREHVLAEVVSAVALG